MSIEELAALPVYINSESQKHTVYDGHIVLFEAQLGVLCKGSLIIEILGPYWDRVYRIEFSAVTVIQATDSQLLRGVDVKKVILSESKEHVNICTITEMFDEGALSIEFESAVVTHYSLNNDLQRSEDGFLTTQSSGTSV